LIPFRFATSAKSNHGIEEAVKSLLGNIFGAVNVGGIPEKQKGLELAKPSTKPLQNDCCSI